MDLSEFQPVIEEYKPTPETSAKLEIISRIRSSLDELENNIRFEEADEDATVKLISMDFSNLIKIGQIDPDLSDEEKEYEIEQILSEGKPISWTEAERILQEREDERNKAMSESEEKQVEIEDIRHDDIF